MFSNREKEFAEKLADKIYRQFPPASEVLLVKQGAKRRLERILEAVLDDLDTFQKEARPGLMGKARLGNAFRWKLSDLGYSKTFVEALTKSVVEHVASKKAV